MEKLKVGLEDEHRSGIVETLNRLLANEHVLYVKTRNYHWNVVGPRFNDLHKFFEEQYTQLEKTIDEVAENARQFGGVAAGSMAEFIELSKLKEHSGDVPDEHGMLSNLLADHETVIRGLREDIKKADEEYNAADAADFLTSVLEVHNKMAWMLRAFLGTGTSSGKGKAERRSSDELVGSRR
jgi:starvation-inducible DNA-binding protein